MESAHLKGVTCTKTWNIDLLWPHCTHCDPCSMVLLSDGSADFLFNPVLPLSDGILNLST